VYSNGPLRRLVNVALTIYTETSRRQSRGKQPKSYRLEEQYSFLDEENGSAHSNASTSDVEEPQQDEDDFFMPDAEEEPEDDFDEDIVENSDSSDEDYPESVRPVTPDLELNIVEIDSDHNPSVRNDGRRNKGRVTTSTLLEVVAQRRKRSVPLHYVLAALRTLPKLEAKRYD
jgi:hypothetical protein